MTIISMSGDGVVESNSNFIRFVVTLSEPSQSQVTVSYRTLLNGTAIDEDLRFSSTSGNYNGLITFAPGQTSGSIFIQTRTDELDERDEAITLELFNPTGGATFGLGQPLLRATGVILDNDGLGANLALFVFDPVLVEGSGTGREAVFEVRLSQPAPSAFTMDFTTANGSAVAGEDYVARAGSLFFSAGQTVATVTVPILGDLASEASEFFHLVITPPSNPSIGGDGSVGTARLLDNDSAPSAVVSVTGDAVGESNSNFIRFVVTLSEPSNSQVSMQFNTLLNGTATDFDLRSSSTSGENNGRLTFNPGQTSASIFIQTSTDEIDERDEAITLQLSNIVGGVFAGGVRELAATGFILDNDGTGPDFALVGSRTLVLEPGAGSTVFRVPVELSRPAPVPVTFDVAAISATAISGADFELIDSRISFAPGQTSAAVGVRILSDAINEAVETFSLNYTHVSGSVFEGIVPSQVISIQPAPAIEPGRVINGSPVNDRLSGGVGNDTVNGGAGVDTYVFTGRSLDYTIASSGGSTTVTDGTALRNGSDTLTNIERLRFSDGTLALDIALPGQGQSNAGSAYRLYEAAFNRAPDNPGLAFWIKAIDGGVTAIRAAQGFVDSAEFRQVYGANPTAQQLVTGFYTNILGRAPEQAGFDFWFNILNNRPDQRAVVLEGIANSPENQNGLIGTIGQGIFVPGDLLA
jgi:hypothetical protein